MKDTLKTGRFAIITFLIGMIAGVAPFLFMQLLPSMLNPTLNITPPNYTAIIVTGLLIGAITSIIFTTGFEKREPQDIFFYALGIPAILIATVSNMGANFEAESALEKATALVNQNNTVVVEKVSSVEAVPRPESVPDPAKTSFLESIIGTAVASDRSEPIQIAARGATYLIVIGEYQSAKAAWAAHNKVAGMRLRTERYVQKNLSVNRLNGSRYVLSYSASHSDKDAERIYKILAINDPQFSVRIIKY
ncbi:MAG: hypothetical protein ACC635_03515 [Acidiferrobacterales bacterium]